jgi:hypothetical protein
VYNILKITFIKTSYIIHAELQKMPTQRFLAAIILMVATVAAAALTSTLFLGGDSAFNQSRIEAAGLGVYWERECVNEIPAINWGYIDPGSSSVVTIFLRNEGASQMSVSLATENWSPSVAQSYITLDVDFASGQLDQQSVLEVDLTLAVSSNVDGVFDFGFDIVITGSE